MPGLGARAASVRQAVGDKLIEHEQYIRRFGDDMPEVQDWRWEGTTGGERREDTAADF